METDEGGSGRCAKVPCLRHPHIASAAHAGNRGRSLETSDGDDNDDEGSIRSDCRCGDGPMLVCWHTMT